jgi:hypothetical protein
MPQLRTPDERVDSPATGSPGGRSTFSDAGHPIGTASGNAQD